MDGKGDLPSYPSAEQEGQTACLLTLYGHMGVHIDKLNSEVNGHRSILVISSSLRA